MAITPSLAMIPSGYKAQKVYSAVPTNGDGDFDFTRSTSATRVNKDGFIEEVAVNVPRLDYSDGGCPSLLLEPTSSNLLPYSEDFSDASWTKFGGGTGVVPIVTLNQGISPDGTNNATRIEFSIAAGTTASDQSIVVDNVTVPSGYTTQKSIYLKSNTSNSYDLIIYESTSASGTNVKKITVTTEWKRFVVYGAVSSTTSGLAFGLRNVNVNGISQSADVLVYGAQLESGSFPTSYIPNYGTAAGITRVAETANGAGDASTFNGSEGVLFAEISALANDSTTRRVNLRNSSGSNQIRIEYGSSPNLITAVLYNGENQAVINGPSYNVIDSNKIAFKYKENDFALWINGIEVGTESIGSTVGAGILDRIDLSDSNPFYGNTKQIQYFDSALTDAELAALTTI